MLNLIVAPKSHNKKAERYAKSVTGYLKHSEEEYAVYFSLDLEDMKENIKYLLGLGESEYVVIGDDKIINIFVNTVKDLSKIKLGIIPTSKYDDFSSYLGINPNPILAIKDILNRKVQSVDILICNDTRVINNVVIGASVDIYEAYNNYKYKNSLTEKYASVKYTKEYLSKNLKIDVKDSKTRSDDIFELVIANGGYSKGKKLSPLSNLGDGLFNLVYVKDVNRKISTKSIKTIFKGNHIYQDNTVQLWGSEAKISSEGQNIKAMLDGEIYELEKIEILVNEGALKIYKTNVDNEMKL